jgi:hypothetical protein
VKYHEFSDGEWDAGRQKPKWKKMMPKEAREFMDEDIPENEARRENRELRKRLARRMRRNERQKGFQEDTDQHG